MATRMHTRTQDSDRGPKKHVHFPTGMTSHKPKFKRPVHIHDRNVPGEPNRLSTEPQELAHPSIKQLYTPVESWSEEEDKALTQFVLFNCIGGSWPSTKGMKLWEGASKFLHNTCKTNRTSKELVCPKLM